MTLRVGSNGSVPATAPTNFTYVRTIDITGNVAIPTGGRVDVYNRTGGYSDHNSDCFVHHWWA